MAVAIHPTAVVDSGARLGVDVEVGAYAVVGPGVEVGDGCVIGAHCVITGPTRIGRNNRFHSQAAIGGDPQDKKYAGERTELLIGDGNAFREFTTINRGTGSGGGVTRIGDDNLFLAYVHVAHDCAVGSHTVFSNNATLAGHVTVGDWVILSGFTGIHQFCRIGEHAFIGMGCLVNGDVPPYLMVADRYAEPRGINSEGLKRRGFDGERIAAIKRAYRTVYMSGKPLAEARQELALSAPASADVRRMLEFIESSERGLLR